MNDTQSVTLVSNVVVGVITGVVTFGLAQVTFRMQRGWERRYSAFKELLEALQKMKMANDELYNDEITYRKMSDQRANELRVIWQSHKAIALKYADIGSYDTSFEVEDVMQQFRTSVERHHNSLFEALDNDGAAVNQALIAIKKLANRDPIRRVFIWLASFSERFGLEA